MKAGLRVVLLGGLTACTPGMQPVEPVTSKPQAAPAEVSPPAKAPEPVGKENCFPIKLGSEPPFYLAEHGIMVTRITKPCKSPTGEAGYEDNTGWMAMGIPCSGGGKIEWRGHYHSPKMVSFYFPNSCAMTPGTKEDVASIGRSMVGLQPKAQLWAYYPLAVQYWELIDYPDADVGYVVDIRSKSGISDGWPLYVKKKAGLKVRLYGRENAWVKDNRFYFVEGEIVNNGEDKFVFKITSAKALSKEEVDDLQKRCEALRPARNCSEVFF